MAFEFKDRSITKVGIVGSGQIGPDIALHFSKVLSPFDATVVVVDINQEALDKGRARLDKKVDRGIKSGAFTEDGGATMKSAVTFTTDYDRLADAELVIEAASENEAIKQSIFAQLEGLVKPTTILASNSSHMEPEVVAEKLGSKARSCVIHYFFPAERNPIVEVVPGAHTDDAITTWLLGFYEAIGKVPIRVKSRYGYALDPIFEGSFQAAAMCVEDGLGTTREVDWAATKALGLTVGPFTAMNLTGGNPITHHGLNMAHDRCHSWFRTPKLLDDAVKSGEAWDVPARGETVELPADRMKAIVERLQGSYLGLCDEVLSAGLVDLSDFEMAVEIALDMTPPVRLARSLGFDKALALIEAVAESQEGFPKPQFFKTAAEKGAVDVPVIQREDRGDVAVLTIRRPKVLNALNQDVFDEIKARVAEVEADDAIKAAVITGFGVKAFVSGADVNFLAGIETPEEGVSTSLNSQSAINAVDKASKPFVAALNGLAFGGGIELAMACRARLCAENLKVLAAQPEPNLGIIPGAGGTQRLPRIVGIDEAQVLLRTGKPINSKKAVEIGLVSREVPRGALVDEAVELARGLAAGTADVPEIRREPLENVPTELPDLDIGHLSKAIDEIIQRAILEGAAKTLDEGLRFEAELFGDVCRTKDMGIGIKNFLTNGPRAKAEFTHS